ncbi:unnamed protein product [Calicophoron daubneyi]
MFEEREIGCTIFSYVKLLARTISDSPVKKVKACPTINILVILASGNLLICDAEQLEIVNFFPTFNDVADFHLTAEAETTPKLCLGFCTQIVKLYSLSKATLLLIFEVRLTYVPRVVCTGLDFICCATDDRYVSVDLKTGVVTDLLEFGENVTKPFVTYVAKDEFLLYGPGSLGIISDASGKSQKAPLQLSPNVVESFVWKNYVFTVTDEFFTIHSIQSQKQLQTVSLSNATAACFSSHGPHLAVVATAVSGRRDQQTDPDLIVIGPERWDSLARKFILADCIKQAKSLLLRQSARIESLLQNRPASSKNEQKIFNVRAKHVFGLLGFYYFEKGDFSRAQRYFEKSLIDIRELLVRYCDLLPNGYSFTPDPFYLLHAQDNRIHSPESDCTQFCGVPELSLAHAIRATDANKNPDNVTVHQLTEEWNLQYDQFLFDFLQKHHKSRFAEEYSHFLETALVKLYIKLLQHGVKPVLSELILPPGPMFGPFTSSRTNDSNQQQAEQSHDLVNLISGLAHIDVEDLMSFLKQSNSPHTLALIYQWQGNLGAALEVWRQLVYGELKDENFPGVDFYVGVLRWLAAPTAEFSTFWTKFELQSQTELFDDSAESSSSYVKLVWQHFCQALESGHFELAETILLALPVCFSRKVSSPTGLATSHTDDSSLAPSQCLTPDNILRKIRPISPDLTRRYLRHLIFTNDDKDSEHHNLLAQLYSDFILRKLDADTQTTTSKECLLSVRREFCRFLRYSYYYSPNALLEILNKTASKSLSYELAILHGKKGDHRSALDILLNQVSDIRSCLSYCLSYLYEDQTRLHRSLICWPYDSSSLRANTAADCQLDSTDTPVSPVAPELFTILVELCLARHDDYHEDIALQLINSPDIPLDYSKVLSLIPGDFPLQRIAKFLRRALLTTSTQASTAQLQWGLSKCCANQSALQVAARPTSVIVHVEEHTKCSRCSRELGAYGPSAPFAWFIKTKQLAHVHCLKDSDQL